MGMYVDVKFHVESIFEVSRAIWSLLSELGAKNYYDLGDQPSTLGTIVEWISNKLTTFRLTGQFSKKSYATVSGPFFIIFEILQSSMSLL